MRLRSGPIPENPNFLPEAEGWARVREPGPLAIQLMALPVAFVTLLASGALIYLAFPREILLNHTAAIRVPTWLGLAIMVLLVPVHECLHVVLHPDHGLSAHSVIGVWLSKGVFYACYDGPMSRNRRLLVLAGPYLVLSLLPIVLIALPGAGAWRPEVVPALALLSLVGGLVACGDIIGFALLAFQAPPTAAVRNKGWRTYWKRDNVRASARAK